MSKLFVFGIGGTGSRVLKSLTMLLQSGVKTGVDEIVPMVIDKDETNGDLVRTKRMIENYINTRDKFVVKDGEFFSTQMSLINDELCLQLVDKKKKFSDYIDLAKLSEPNQAIVEALFSKSSLAMETTEGFRGVPSIGSVVLNQFEDSDIFEEFAKRFQPGDKIFIISSIFGGTGASGFPLLTKTLRGDSTLTGWNYVQNAPLGAVSVLPYFIVGKPNEEGKVNVDSDTFSDKAKAALDYYAQSLDRELDNLYYVADQKYSHYKYSAGGKDQENQAQITEMLAALSIVDFSFNGARGNRTVYKEFGIINPQKNGTEIVFTDLHDDTKKILCAPLVQFYVFSQYMRLMFDKQNAHQPWSHNYPWKKAMNFDKAFKQSEAARALSECIDNFSNWLIELDDKSVHTHRFSPFNLESITYAFVKGESDDIAVNNPDFRYKNWAWMDNTLNSYCTSKELQVSESLTKEQRFLELFYRASLKFVQEIVPNSKDWFN